MSYPRVKKCQPSIFYEERLLSHTKPLFSMVSPFSYMFPRWFPPWSPRFHRFFEATTWATPALWRWRPCYGCRPKSWLLGRSAKGWSATVLKPIHMYLSIYISPYYVYMYIYSININTYIYIYGYIHGILTWQMGVFQPHFTSLFNFFAPPSADGYGSSHWGSSSWSEHGEPIGGMGRIDPFIEI